MTIEYSFTKRHLRDVWNYLRGHNRISIKNAQILYVVAPLLFLLLYLVAKYCEYVYLRIVSYSFLFGSIVSIPLHIAYDKWLFYDWIKTGFSRSVEDDRFLLAIGEDNLVITKPGFLETKIHWESITSLIQRGSITILPMISGNCLYFPTDSMSPDQREELADLVARHVPTRKP